MKKMIVFIVLADIVVLIGVIVGFFMEAEVRAYIMLSVLCLSFISYHVVSAYVVWQNRVLSKVKKIRLLYRYIYLREPSGGALHIVLDDWNVEDSHIKWCLGQLDFLESKGELEEDMKSKYEEIGNLLLTFCEFDRLRILRDCELIYSRGESI